MSGTAIPTPFIYDPNKRFEHPEHGTILSTSECLDIPWWKTLKNLCKNGGLHVEGDLTQQFLVISKSFVRSPDQTVMFDHDFDIANAGLFPDLTKLEVIKSLRKAYNQARPAASASASASDSPISTKRNRTAVANCGGGVEEGGPSKALKTLTTQDICKLAGDSA